jgi:hypothetical protein
MMVKRRFFARIGMLLLAAGCGSAAGPAATPPAAPPAPLPQPAFPPPSPPATPARLAAPWSGDRLAAAAVPTEFVTEWRRAENRATCAPIAPIAPASLGEGAGARPRRANFSGGWAVAYDQPGLRSAFGVAGTGSRASDPAYDEWPHRRVWADGSSAGYGPEGGTGPSDLAYLRIQGQECLYNVWSLLGRAHLEHLLDSLRFVAVPQG